MNEIRMAAGVPGAVVVAVVVALALGLGGCGSEPMAIEAEPAAEATSAPTPWVAVRSPDDESLLEAPAIVRAAGASGAVSASVQVRVVRLHVSAGSVVSAGDPVVDVAAPELLDAAATYVGSRRGARAHGERAGQLEELRAEGLVNHSQVFERRARSIELTTEHGRAAALLRSAGVEPSAAAGLLRRGFLTLNSPVDGVVTALEVRVGEVREPGAGPLARIFGEGTARIEVRTTEMWPEATSVRFEASDARIVELQATPLSSVVDPDDGTRLTWYAPAEDIALPDGLTGTARISAAADVWEVPVRAVAQRTGASEVVRRRDGATQRIAVNVLGSSGATALVRGDLVEGDEVRDDISQLQEDEAPSPGEATP